MVSRASTPSSARLRHSTASLVLPQTISACLAPHTKVNFLTARFLRSKMLEPAIGVRRTGYSRWSQRTGGSFDTYSPKSCSSLVIVEGILVHAQQRVCLTKTIPRSVILPVDVCSACNWHCSVFTDINTHRPHVDMPQLPHASSSFQHTHDP